MTIVILIAVIITLPGVAGTAETTQWNQYLTIQVEEAIPTTETLTLKPLWSLDCGPDAETLVGKIKSVAPGLEGRTLLLDSQLSHVLVVGPDGTVEGTMGRLGDGPGDLPGAYRAFQLKDGRLGVAEGAPAPTITIGGVGKIVLLNPAGEPAGIWHGVATPGQMPLVCVREMRCANDHVLLATQHLEMSQGLVKFVRELSLLSPPDGNALLLDTLVHEESLEKMESNEANTYEPFAYGRCDVSAQGRVAYAPQRDQWLVVVREPDGTGMVLQRPWKAIPRSKARLEQLRTDMGPVVQMTFLKNRPAIGRIRWRPDGKLWVEPIGADLLPGVFACFDEFSPEGQLLRRVQISVPGDPEHDILIIMENGRFGLLRGFKNVDADDTPETDMAEVLLLTS